MLNTSYIFIPFTFDREDRFGILAEAMDKHSAWELVTDKITYLLKYIVDKFNAQDRENCQCFHYKLREEYASDFGLSFHDTVYAVRDENNDSVFYDFRMQSLQFYCFSTTVGIAALQIEFIDSDPYRISNAEYHLKKVARKKNSIFVRDNPSISFTLLDKVKAALAVLDRVNPPDFFFYANEGTERANILTFLEVEDTVDDQPRSCANRKDIPFKKELYYLRRCYHKDRFSYMEDEKLDEVEIHSAGQNILWGISPEAAVCLAYPEDSDKTFTRTVFFTNFNAQYLFMYILLLHQKYVLYMFLTRIGIGALNSLGTLKKYSDELYEFETDFVFSCITEVPQYQMLYEKMSAAFSLKTLYDDVREPLTSLSEIRERENEKERRAKEEAQQKKEKRLNLTLSFLSLLTLFSALFDGFSFIDTFVSGSVPTAVSVILKVIIGVLFLLTGVFAIINLIPSKKK